MAAGTDQKTASGAYILTAKQERYLRTKHRIDGVIAALLILVLAVPMAVIMLILKLLSPREPVFFRHQRVGENGQLFELIKFRSMRGNTPKYIAAADFSDSGEYITRFGRFLRCTSLDELPQLFHVLTGKMSLIGPRPLIPQEEAVHARRQADGVYRLRPGITGWAQINGRDAISDEEKTDLDRYYLEHVSFALDWKIFWVTLRKVVLREDVERCP